MGFSRQISCLNARIHSYDPAGHLLSEQRNARSSDALRDGVRDYLWDDRAPVAQIDGHSQRISNRIWSWLRDIPGMHRHDDDYAAARERISYLHTDAIGTPRLATNAKQQVVWRWNEDAFGAKVSAEPDRHSHRDRDHDEDHGRRHGIQVHLRYPGQYYDSETGLFYNWNRYYDPSTGRYGRSDPIGLSGGVSTFGYALGNPILYTDPSGRIVGVVAIPIAEALGDAIAYIGSAVEAGYAAHKATEYYKNSDKSSEDGKPYAGGTPDDKPKNYKLGEESGDKVNKTDGSIWSPDKDGHGGSKWKRWPNKRDKKNNKNRESVRPDGSCR
jgi:RHS repeat-associated protein